MKNWSPIYTTDCNPFTRVTIRLCLWLKRALGPGNLYIVYTTDSRWPDQVFIWAFGIFPYRSVVNTQKGARRKETWLTLWLPLFYHFLLWGKWLPFQGKTLQKYWTALEDNGEGMSQCTIERTIWQLPRTGVWFQLVLKEFSDQEWYENFRLSRATFQFLLKNLIQNWNRKIQRWEKLLKWNRKWVCSCTSLLQLQVTEHFLTCLVYPGALFTFVSAR